MFTKYWWSSNWYVLVDSLILKHLQHLIINTCLDALILRKNLKYKNWNRLDILQLTFCNKNYRKFLSKNKYIRKTKTVDFIASLILESVLLLIKNNGTTRFKVNSFYYIQFMLIIIAIFSLEAWWKKKRIFSIN